MGERSGAHVQDGDNLFLCARAIVLSPRNLKQVAGLSCGAYGNETIQAKSSRQVVHTVRVFATPSGIVVHTVRAFATPSGIRAGLGSLC